MKLFNLVLLAAVLSFAAACGKNNESGGSRSSYPSNLGTGSNNLTSSARQAVEHFNRWYASNYEPSSSYGVYALTYASSSGSSSNNNNCELKDIEVFGVVVGQYYWCSGGMTGGTGSYEQCQVSVMYNQNNKSVKGQNPTLAKIAGGQAGILVDASFQGNTSNYSNSVFTLKFQKSNGHVVTYTINTTYHSAMQPIQVTDTQNSSWMYLYNIAPIMNGQTLPVCD